MMKQKLPKLPNFFKLNMSIRSRLIFGFGLIIVFNVILFVYLFISSNQNSRVAKENLFNFIPSETEIAELSNLVDETKMLVKNCVYIDKLSNTEDKIHLKTIQDSSYFQIKSKLNSLSDQWSQENSILLQNIFTSIEDSLFAKQKGIMAQLNTFESYDDPMILFEVFPMIEQDGELTLATLRIKQSINHLLNYFKIESQNGNVKLLRSYSSFKYVMIFSILISILLGFLTTLISIRSIIKPINSLKSEIKLNSRGNFTEKELIHTKDEIGEMSQALQRMSENIRKIVKTIRVEAVLLAQNSSNIDKMSKEISSGAITQATNSEEISSSMEELAVGIVHNSSNAKETKEIASSVAKNIQDILKAVSDTNEAMLKISDKNHVVDEIANKIDLLAINAAIEAARSGEHGVGFTVIAHEIRKLSERSQIVAKEIKLASDESVQIANHSTQLLTDLIPSINQTEENVKLIAQASEEQSTGVEQINRAIQELTLVTQENSSSSKELSEGSADLKKQSETLLNSIGFFKTEDQEVQKATRESKRLKDEINKLENKLNSIQLISI